MSEVLDHLTQWMGDLEEEKVLQMASIYAGSGNPDVMPAITALNQGMQIVGERFDQCEYFVGDLIAAGAIFSEALEILRPLMPKAEPESCRDQTILLCTVESDYHDIGKNIVKYVMQSEGLSVLDLGVNVPPEQIVKTAIDKKIRIIALSAVLTSSVDSMRATIEAFRKAGLRDQVRILIGGSCTSEKIAAHIGADAWGNLPGDSARICSQWARELRSKD